MPHIALPPASLGLGRNWYRLLADFQAWLPWQPLWMVLSLEQRVWQCQLISTRFSVCSFSSAHSQNVRSAVCARWRLRAPLRATSLCIWVLLQARRGDGGYFGHKHFSFYSCCGLFDMHHCCCVIMLGLWLSWRLALSTPKSVEETKMHEKLLPLLKAFELNPFQTRLWKLPPALSEGSKLIKNKPGGPEASDFPQMSFWVCEVQCCTALN